MEADDRAQADLGMERYERTLEALYEAMTRCVPDDLIRHLCAETGVSYADLERYVPPILRPKSKTEGGSHPVPFLAVTPEQQAWIDEYETSELNQETQMGRFAQDTGGGDFQQAPAGSHIARCIKIVDIGTHHGEYQGAPIVRNQIIVQWELPNETMLVDGKPMPLVVSKFYTNSLSEKANLRKDLESWRARPFTPEELGKFDLMKILGVGCMVSVVHNDKGKAKVVSVSALPRGMECPPAVNTPEAFWIDEFDQKKFDALSEGFKRLVTESDEYQAMFVPPGKRAAAATQQGGDMDDDIPFLLNECMYDIGTTHSRRQARGDCR